MWTLAGIIVALLSVFIVAFYGNIFKDISDFLSVAYPSVKMQFGINIYLVAAEILGIFIITFTSGYLMIFTAVSIGQLFRSHRVAYSVGAYFALYILNQILATICLSVLSFTNKTLWSQFANNDLRVISSWLFLFIAIAAMFSVAAYFI
jgi:hypothetical protein